jgi:transposase InsO family protein
VIRALIQEAVDAGARRWRACEVIRLSVRTLERWADNDEDRRRGPNHVPANKLSETERQKAIAVMTAPEFRDQSPKQIVPALATRGEYIGSESTLYRLLHDEGMQHRRGRARAPVARPTEHVADGPMQVAAWDITYLRSHVRGSFFYLYLVEDVWSRKIIGWAVHELESAELAAGLVEKIRLEADGRDLTGWVLHSDNGAPMKGATMLATLQRLGVISSFSRPSVSDDNAYAESLFRTMKYRAKYPSSGFATIDEARVWIRDFVAWYNHEHQHSGIGYVSPATRHVGDDLAILAARRDTYKAARRRHPERWARQTRSWSRPATVTLNQKVDHAAEDIALAA